MLKACYRGEVAQAFRIFCLREIGYVICPMKNLMMFLFAFACVSVSPLTADERSDVYMEWITLKQEIADRSSGIESAELGAENRKGVEAEAAVKKAIEELPALAPQRKARDEAEAALMEALKAQAGALKTPPLEDLAKMKTIAQGVRDAQRTLERDALKLDEVKKLKAAAAAQHKKIKALAYRLVAESGDEGQELVEKIKRLEARRQELEK
ncbi:hypothetical protein V2O64_25660 (plasmid) [Verrucomicrobiaceae bacterium 227]